MKYCKSCNLTYEAPLKHCLFCNNPLQTISSSEVTEEISSYPRYKRMHHIRRILIKVLTFLVIISNFICLFINYRVSDGKLSWSIYVFAATLYTLTVVTLFSRRSVILHKIVWLMLYTQLLLLVIALEHGGYHWFTDFVLPITTMALNLFSTCYLFGKRHRIYDYSIYTITISLLGVLLGLLIVFSVIHQILPTVICMIYSIITLLALIFFSPKAFLEEIQRRLHF